jgi:predicted double-glycine peptidase
LRVGQLFQHNSGIKLGRDTMTSFHLLTRARQVTEYSCGACALQAVLSYWGTHVDEQELMKLLHTTSEEGTYPEDIVRGARALGFEAEAKCNLTLEDVERFTAAGSPMLAVAQVWRSESKSPGDVQDDWDNGHWIVILGVDKDYVYFQDPYARMSKAFIPRQAFETHWHQAMGGDLKKNPQLIHLGIQIRGKQPETRSHGAGLGLATLDFEKFGSLNLMIVQFPRFLLPYDFLDEMKDIWADGSIRPDAFIFLRKDKDGNVMGMQGSRLQDGDDIAAINVVIAAITSRSVGSPEGSRASAEAALTAAAEGDFGLSAGDIRKIADKLGADHSAIILLFENVWERKLKDIAKRYDGSVVEQRLISPAALAKMARSLTASS